MSSPGISAATRVSYAQAFLELGMTKDAAAELDAVLAADQRSPVVLLARAKLGMDLKDWASVVAFARATTQAAPQEPYAWIWWAYGQRRLTTVADARAVLLDGASHIGATCDLLYFNLACYDCQLGDLASAKARLRRAFAMEPGWRKLAQAEPDLAPLHGQLDAIK